MRPLAVAGLGLAGALAVGLGSTLLPTAPILKCDDPASLATVEELAGKKLAEGVSARYLLKSADFRSQIAILTGATSGNVVFVPSAIRNRGAFGRGISCAALLVARAGGGSAQMATEYVIEPTAEGTLVSAKFFPN